MRNGSFLAVVLAVLFAGAGCATRKPVTPPALVVKKDTAARTDAFLQNLLSRYPQYFDTLLQQNSRWQVKIIYTQIDRKANNRPVFTDHFFSLDPKQYFYPASTVKMPVAFLALQKLNELKLPGLDKNTTMITGAAYSGQTSVFNDPQSEDGRPTIANYIRKIFLVSDNDAFNRLYEFLGQEYINNQLHKMGYDSAQVLHHLNVSLSEDQNRHTNPVEFYDTSSRLIYSQPPVFSQLVYQRRHTFLGSGYNNGSTVVNHPFDFSKKNRLALADLHSILEAVLFPEVMPPQQRFGLTEDDYHFLYRYMSMKPAESTFPQYDSSYADAYSKFLLYGGKGKMEEGMRIFNKEGDAYGFLTDVAYVVDFKNNVEFILSASIYCNSDGIFNDDHYDYEKVGLPFMKNLGKVIYEYELQRKRKNVPDLSKFKLDYSK
jgi:hypothetical protein